MTEKVANISKIDLKKINTDNIEINIPSSKSYLNRALILASLQKTTLLTNVGELCSDAKDMITALRKVGINIDLNEKNCCKNIVVNAKNGKFVAPKDGIINCGLGGTTTRFMLGLSALFDFDITITAEGKMLERPVKEMFEFLQNIGKDIVFLGKDGCLPVVIKHKPLKNIKKIKLDGSKSSQFLTAILLVADRLNIEEIDVKNLVSKSYINITLDVLKKSGIAFIHNTFEDKITYRISHTNKIINDEKLEIEIEKDFSSASYFLALQYLFDVKNDILKMPKKSSQGDANFVNIIEKIREYSHKTDKTKPLILDMKNMPDVSMTAMIICALQGFTTKITGLKTLKIKECDRLTAMQNELKKVGIKTKITPSFDAITIYGRGDFTLKNKVEIDTYNDHRIAMCFAILGTKIGNLSIKNADVVNKSFPNFWQELSKFGCVKIDEKI